MTTKYTLTLRDPDTVIEITPGEPGRGRATPANPNMYISEERDGAVVIRAWYDTRDGEIYRTVHFPAHRVISLISEDTRWKGPRHGG